MYAQFPSGINRAKVFFFFFLWPEVSKVGVVVWFVWLHVAHSANCYFDTVFSQECLSSYLSFLLFPN